MKAQVNEETIGDIVARDYRKAAIFKNLGIDFSCGGKQTLAEASKQLGLPLEEVCMQLITGKTLLNEPEMDFQGWDIGFMCEYLVQLHHLYIKTNTPFILELSQKISNTYAEKHSEITQVTEIFGQTGKQLMLNIAKEKHSLFPYIIALNKTHKNGAADKETVINPVAIPAYLAEAEHVKIAKNFRMIRKLTNNYQLPPYVSHSYNILYKMLQEYEDDIYLHLHLENNILFPRAIQMENAMQKKECIK
jgi:regulator of cell morphogenesis and NO signaling